MTNLWLSLFLLTYVVGTLIIYAEFTDPDHFKFGDFLFLVFWPVAVPIVAIASFFELKNEL